MSTSVTINGSDYLIPEQGQNPPWGEDLNSLLDAMVELLNASSSSTDISTTLFTIANNTASVANVIGLSFDTTQVRSGIISYSVYRSTSTTELSESGQMYITYKSTAGTWELAQYLVGSSGVTFTITSGGQIQYVSSNLGGTGYTGKMKFNAKTFIQT